MNALPVYLDTSAIMKKRFLRETMRMAKLRIASVIPIKIRILRDSWALLEKHNIYETDALQIASAKYIESERFLTGDKRLHEVAIKLLSIASFSPDLELSSAHGSTYPP